MCSKGSKEHEAILATDAEPYQIHTMLLLTGAKEGKPGTVFPEVRAANRQCYRDRGYMDAEWQGPEPGCAEMDQSDKKTTLERDWVFAGSQFYDDPITKKKRYAADDGDLITVANFSSAILDLPIGAPAMTRTVPSSTKHRADSSAGHRGFRRPISAAPSRQWPKPGAVAPRTPMNTLGSPGSGFGAAGDPRMKDSRIASRFLSYGAGSSGRCSRSNLNRSRFDKVRVGCSRGNHGRSRRASI